MDSMVFLSSSFSAYCFWWSHCSSTRDNVIWSVFPSLGIYYGVSNGFFPFSQWRSKCSLLASSNFSVWGFFHFSGSYLFFSSETSLSRCLSILTKSFTSSYWSAFFFQILSLFFAGWSYLSLQEKVFYSSPSPWFCIRLR